MSKQPPIASPTRTQRLDYQRAVMKTKFLQITELSDEAVLAYKLAVGEDQARVIQFRFTSIAVQMLQCLDRRFFAGFSQTQLEELVSSGIVHPKTMLTRSGEGTYSIHTLNYMHLRPKAASSYQRFACLATTGGIAWAADQLTGEQGSLLLEKKKEFEAVPFIKFSSQGDMKETTPFEGRWAVLRAYCADFYRRVVLARDSREAYKECIIEFEDVPEGLEGQRINNRTPPIRRTACFSSIRIEVFLNRLCRSLFPRLRQDRLSRRSRHSSVLWRQCSPRRQNGRMLTNHSDAHEALLHETERPLVVDAEITAVARLHLVGARGSTRAQPSALPLATRCAQLHSAGHRVCGARPAVPDPYPSLAVQFPRLARNDGRAGRERPAGGLSGCVGGGAQRSVAA